jgi:3-oxoacyl-[acyl-carrier protein] reductase
VKALFEQTIKAFGKLDVLVNNAGVYAFAPIDEVTEESFHRHFNINVLGPLLTIKEALKHFPADGGSVVNVSSVAAYSPVPTASVYSGTKGALDIISQVLALELGARNVRINTVSPGLVETEGTHVLGTIGGDFEAQIVGRTPLSRVGQPRDIAKVVVFLASNDSGWLTGERITASGGYR